MSLLRSLSGSKIGTSIGTALLTAAGILQAINLDPWAHERAPWLAVLSIVCTGIGTPLAATGRGLGTSDARRAEDPPTTHTAEMRAPEGPEDTAA